MAPSEGKDLEEASRRALELLSAPCNVRALSITGNKRTKRALIEAELRTAVAASSHEDLAIELALASQRLQDLDVFKSASCEVDIVPEGPSGDVVVSVKVEEKGTATLSTGTYVQGGEGNLEFSCALRNLLGNAERLQGHVSVGHQTSNSFRIEATQPLEFGSTARINVAAFQTFANFVKYSSFRERQRGVTVSLTDAESPHEFSYHAAWRTVVPQPNTFVWYKPTSFGLEGVVYSSGMKPFKGQAD